MSRILLTSDHFRKLVSGEVITVMVAPSPSELLDGRKVEIALSDIGYVLMEAIIAEVSQRKSNHGEKI